MQDRIRDHAKAFNGLLSLIPAKMYYGEDTSDQWKKKKQTKEQARAAKKGKLDPDSELNRSAKDVLDERARNKRKVKELEAEDNNDNSEDDDDIEIDGVEKERPLEGLKKKEIADEENETPATKKQKVGDEAEQLSAVEKTPNKKLSAKDEKKSAKKQKQEEAKRLKVEGKGAAAPAKPQVQPSTEVDSGHDDDDDDMEDIDVSGLVSRDDESAESESTTDTPVFDTNKADSAEPASTTTSIASAVPPSEKPKYLNFPVDAESSAKLKAKLEAKINQLRASRKAADADGNPVKTRNELIESRRATAARRKEHKIEMRKLAKIEENKKREETLASARNSPALSALLADQDDDDKATNNFSFGRLAFTDGTKLSHDATFEKGPGSSKKKGPSDPKTALLKFESQKKRIAGLDEEKRKKVLEQEAWLAAKKRVEGEKVHDNESLLKKALKRKEKGKKKSEKEWKERAQAVGKSMYDRQKKRETNLQKRKDDKMAHRAGKKNKGVATKKKSRPGFEGGFGKK